MEMNEDARDAKQSSMAQVDDAANPIWKEAAYDAVVSVASEQPTLNADHVLARIPDNIRTHELRALGPIMRRAARDNIIIKSLRPWVFSARRSRHAAPLQVWDSLIYTPKGDQ
jgi:hypothetical protein